MELKAILDDGLSGGLAEDKVFLFCVAILGSDKIKTLLIVL